MVKKEKPSPATDAASLPPAIAVSSPPPAVKEEVLDCGRFAQNWHEDEEGQKHTLSEEFLWKMADLVTMAIAGDANPTRAQSRFDAMVRSSVQERLNNM